MKITQLELFTVPPRWLFLKISTDEGIAGWGEPIVEGQAATVAAAVTEMADYLIGRDPDRIQDIWETLYRARFYRGGAVSMSAIAGIDQALVGHQRQAARRPHLSTVGRPRARSSARLLVDRRRPPRRRGAAGARSAGARLHGHQDELHRGTGLRRFVCPGRAKWSSGWRRCGRRRGRTSASRSIFTGASISRWRK